MMSNAYLHFSSNDASIFMKTWMVCQGFSINSHGNPSDGSRMAKFRRWWPPHGPKIKVHVLVQINVPRRQSHVCVHYYCAPPWIRRKDDEIIRLHHLQSSFSWNDATRSAWWWWCSCLLLGEGDTQVPTTSTGQQLSGPRSWIPFFWLIFWALSRPQEPAAVERVLW